MCCKPGLVPGYQGVHSAFIQKATGRSLLRICAQASMALQLVKGSEDSHGAPSPACLLNSCSVLGNAPGPRDSEQDLSPQSRGHAGGRSEGARTEGQQWGPRGQRGLRVLCPGPVMMPFLGGRYSWAGFSSLQGQVFGKCSTLSPEEGKHTLKGFLLRLQKACWH